MGIPARFQFIRELGHGGMGVVYEVYDSERGMRVALKTVHKLEPDDIVRCKREFRALSRFNHPNVIHLYELVAEGDELCFTMEVVDGRHILSYVCHDKAPPRGTVTQRASSNWDVPAAEALPDEMTGERLGFISEFVSEGFPVQHAGQTATTLHVPTLVIEEIAAIDAASAAGQAGAGDQAGDAGDANETSETVEAAPVPGEAADSSERVALAERVDLERMGATLGQLADALRALHAAGMVHCDLTPANVMVTHEGRVVVMDFGVVAALRRSANLGALPTLAGTPSFIAPEQLRGAAPTAATDWYSFGVILYLLLTGRKPFAGPAFELHHVRPQKDPPPASQFTAGIPAELEALCLRLLARDPGQRPTGDEVQSVLARSLPVPGSAGTGLPGGGPGAGPGGIAGEAGAEVFVGRKDELALLHQSLERVREHGLQCVVISGPSGMGKSTLASRFTDEIGQADSGPAPGQDPAAPAPLVLFARCHDRETLAYKALDSIIDGIYLYLDEVPVAQRPELAPRHVGLLARLFPVLARLPEHEHEDQAELAASVELRTQAVGSLRELLGAVARRRPLVLLIEDLQWADGDSFDLLGGLLRPPAVPGLLLILTVRADALARPPLALARFLDVVSEHPEQRRITLGPLTPEEQEELARRLDTGHGGRLQVDDAVWQASAGHPLLLAELVRYARSAPVDRPALGVPPLEELLWRRVTGVGESGRVLLETLAVMGEPAPVPVLARAAALPPADRERALVAVTTAQLARVVRTDRDTWLDVYHDKLRQSVLGRLLPEHLRRLHGRIAGVMEDWPEAPPAALAHHWMAAGARDKAVDYLMKTARSSESKLAFERAGHLYREVATLLEDAPQTPALDACRMEAWLGLARGMRLGDRHDEAMGLLARAQPLATELQRDEELAEIHYLRGNLLFLRGDFDGCMAEHQRALIHATRATSPRLQACALSGLGDAHYLRGRMGAAQKYYDRCIELCTQHRFFDTESANLTVRGLMRFYHNDFAGALHDGEHAVLLASRIGHERAEISAVLNALTRVWIERGEIERARPEIERVHDMAKRGGMRRFEATAKVFLGRMLADQGKLDEGEALIDAGVTMMRATNITFILPLALGMLARAARSESRREAALNEGRNLLAAGSPSINHLYFHRDAMDVYLALGKHDLVLDHADALAAYTGEEPLPWSQYFIARGRALVAHARDRVHPGTRSMLAHLLRKAHEIGFHVAARGIEEALG
jgi:tetratricopeptide (TPR) repeat protein